MIPENVSKCMKRVQEIDQYKVCHKIIETREILTYNFMHRNVCQKYKFRGYFLKKIFASKINKQHNKLKVLLASV